MSYDVKVPAEGYAYGSSKTYVHSVGLSCCFRQWRAKSHCRFLHGYALQVRVEFETDQLDSNNWVVDFGGLKPFKAWLEETFDHKTLVAEDDPSLPLYRQLAGLDGVIPGFRDVETPQNFYPVEPLIQLVVVPSVGVEAFSRMIYEWLYEWLKANEYQHIKLLRVSINEHDSNGAWYGIRQEPLYTKQGLQSVIERTADSAIQKREQSRSRFGV